MAYEGSETLVRMVIGKVSIKGSLLLSRKLWEEPTKGLEQRESAKAWGGKHLVSSTELNS